MLHTVTAHYNCLLTRITFNIDLLNRSSLQKLRLGLEADGVKVTFTWFRLQVNMDLIGFQFASAIYE